jgi:type I restriction enzyme S subunit
LEYGKGLPKAKRNPDGNVPVPVYGSSGVAGYHDQPLNNRPCLIIGRKGAAGSVHLSEVPCWTIDTAYYIEPPNGIELAYLFYVLRTAELSGLDKSTAVPSLSRDDAYAVSVPLAPTNEQRRVVEKIEELFTKVDAGVQSLKQTQALLGSYRRSVLKAAVEGEISREWREAHIDELEPASELLERILQERRETFEGKKHKEPDSPDTSKLPALPAGWVWTNIDSLTVVVRGASPRPAGHPRYFGGDIPWITVGEITKDNRTHLTSVSEYVTEEGKGASRYVEPGTFLLTNSGATLGVPKITNIGGCINDGSVALVSLPESQKLYLYYLLTSKTQELRSINQGAAQPNLNTTIVRGIPVPLPPEEEQRFLVQELQRRLSLIDKLEATVEENLKQANALRQSILKQAFSGELVPQDPDDEPASVLLEQIRQERETTNPKGRKKGGRVTKNSPSALESPRLFPEQGA